MALHFNRNVPLEERSLLSYNKEEFLDEEGKEENKELTKLITNKKIGYSFPDKDGNQIFYLNPILDKLVCTIKVEDWKHQKFIRETIISRVKDCDFPHWTATNPHFYSKTFYANICKITPPGNCGFIVLRASPKKNSIGHFIKLEMNPNNLGEKGISFLIKSLGEILPKEMYGAETFRGAKITKYDVAVDIINSPLTDAYFTHRWKGKSLIIKSAKGKVESLYGGKTKTRGYKIKLYDKKQEQLDKNKQPIYKTYEHIRFEIMMGQGSRVENFEKIKNPFENVKFLNTNTLPLPGEPVYSKFILDSCKLQEFYMTISQLPSPLEIEFRKFFSDSIKATWKPNLLWQSWPDYLTKIGL